MLVYRVLSGTSYTSVSRNLRIFCPKPGVESFASEVLFLQSHGWEIGSGLLLLLLLVVVVVVGVVVLVVVVLLQLSCHSVAVVLTLVQRNRIRINIHKQYQNTAQTIQTTVNTSTHITKTPFWRFSCLQIV